MGLYDGLGGIRKEGSSYHLAEVTDTSIILVVDVHGMGYSMIPFISGFLEYDKKHLIKGIILNRISKNFYETISPIIKEEISIEVLGYFENKEELKIDSRHLGLKLPNEIEDIKALLDKGVDYIEKTVNIDRLIELADGEDELKTDRNCGNNLTETEGAHHKSLTEKDYNINQKLTLAVARDEAFCFYYEANLRMFEEKGVTIKYFSPIHDKELPQDVDGILLGGGYPETYAKELSQNKSMLVSVKKAIAEGLPSLAECGGFMYLHKELKDDMGSNYSMVGVIDEEVYYTGKSVRFGYIELKDKSSKFLSNEYIIKGHEFHYYDSTDNGADVCAVKPTSEKSWDCCYVSDNHWWGFPHLYYPSCPSFVDEFIKRMEERKIKN